MQTAVYERNWLNLEPPEGLAEALTAFNNSTVQLQQAYIALQLKFAALNRKLEETNSELNHKVDELNEVQEYLNSILHSATNGVIAQNLDGNITAFNAAAERITGLSGKKVIGKPFNAVFETRFAAPSNRTNDSKPFERYVSCDMKVKGHPAFPVRESTSLMRDSRGRVTGAVKVFEDLTELRELEEQARRQDRLAALGQMSATVAHEIRNPLGGIEGFASLLARDFEPDDGRLKLVTKILEGARSLNRIVTELLVFTRPVKLSCQPVDARELVGDALGLLAEDIRKANVSLRKRLGSKKIFLHGDPEQLKRVVLNLALNAVQAMPQGGCLEVSCRKHSLPHDARAMLAEGKNGRWVDISIRDTGPGIDENDLQLIFNPFYTKKEKGTGLGLAIAQKIVEAHNGQILVSNSSEGGAEFTVSLPAAT